MRAVATIASRCEAVDACERLSTWRAAMTYIWQRRGWPRTLTWSAEPLLGPLGEARRRQGLLLGKVSSLGVDRRRGVQLDMVTEEAVATSAIEGEHLEPGAVRAAVARRLGLSAAGLPAPDRHVDGLVATLLDAAGRMDEPLTGKRLKEWHRNLFPQDFLPSRRMTVGDWRRHSMAVVSGPPQRRRIHFEAPPAAKVTGEMHQFFAWWKASRGDVEGLLRAGVAHVWFLTVHPFDDGNGRVARAICEMALAQDEGTPQRFYSVAAQIAAERDAYYAMLERAQRGDGDVTEWLAWFLGCLGRALDRAERQVESVLGRVRFWQQPNTAGVTDRQRMVVDRLLDAGPGGLEGGLSTRRYAGIGGTSRATAQREIADLLARGLIAQRRGGGRSTSYDVTLPDPAVLDELRRRFDNRLATLNEPDAAVRLRAIVHGPAKLRGRVKAEATT